MKKNIYIFLIISSFFLMLCFPQKVIHGASQGLLLWFEVLVPTLLPFMMISRLLIKSNILQIVSPVLTPVIGHFFHTNAMGAYCILCGFLCGYPMGAKMICDLYEEHAFTKEHAEYLLCFCNNVSPGFISGFIIQTCLKRTDLLPVTLLILYGVPVLFSFILRFFQNDSLKNNFSSIRTVSAKYSITFYDWNDLIMNSFDGIVNLGGYVIVFRIITEFILSISVMSPLLKGIFAGLFEITSGIPFIMQADTVFHLQYILVLMIAAFGGMSGIAQTYGIVKKQKLSIRKYLTSKIIQALLVGMFTFTVI